MRSALSRFKKDDEDGATQPTKSHLRIRTDDSYIQLLHLPTTITFTGWLHYKIRQTGDRPVGAALHAFAKIREHQTVTRSVRILRTGQDNVRRSRASGSPTEVRIHWRDPMQVASQRLVDCTICSIKLSLFVLGHGCRATSNGL